MEKTKLVISVVTYGRIRKWIGLMRNLKAVKRNCPESIELSFLFVEDSKSRFDMMYLKCLISRLIVGKVFKYIEGKDNLGQSRDLAIRNMSLDTTFFGFIDDDDRYDPKVLNVLEPFLTMHNSLSPSIINFGMSGNFHLTNPPYKGYPERKNRLRLWDDKSDFGCIPSCASFIRLSDWRNFGLSFGKNIPSEETTPLMLFTYYSRVVAHVGIELMSRDRANKSLVRDLSIYDRDVIANNIKRHVLNLKYYTTSKESFDYLYKIFKYNYGSYFKTHGAMYVDEIFKEIENE